MKFDIARQPLVPAFLTLAAFSCAAIVRLPAQATADATALNAAAETVTEGMALLPPDAGLAAFQSAHPFAGCAAAICLALFAGLTTGRIALRYNLYRVGTCLPLVLYAIVACGIAPQPHYLASFAASALLALAVKNFARAFCNGYGFDGIFRASLYLGMLVVLAPTTLPLVLLLPLAIIFFRRTLRETIVAAAGLLLAPFVYCYANWGAGGELLAPLRHMASALLAGHPFDLLLTSGTLPLAALGATLLLTLVGALCFFADIYALGTKPRFILRFVCCTALLCTALTLLPSADGSLFALLAVPAALVIPVHFVRINRTLSLLLYLLLAGLAVANIVIQ